MIWIKVAMVLVVALSAAAGFPGRAAAGVAEWLERMAETHGGRAALARLSAFRQVGRTVSAMRGGTTGQLTRVFQAPGRLRVEIAYPGAAPEVRLLDGSEAWKGGRPATGPLRAAMVLQAARLVLPWLLLERAAEVRDLGSETAADGSRRRVLGLALEPGLALLVELDLETARILRSRGLLRQGQARMEFATDYSGFRQVEGILLAGREDQSAMGRPTGHNLIDQMELLESVPDGLFRP